MAVHSIFVADASGPVIGLTPTWLTYLKASNLSALTGPTFQSAGNGLYVYTPNTALTDIVGVADLGSTAGAGYQRYVPVSTSNREDAVATVYSATTGLYDMVFNTLTSTMVAIPWVSAVIINGSGTVIRSFTTNSSGSATITLDPGTYTVKPYKPEWNFSDLVFTVTGTGTQTITGTSVIVSSAVLTPQEVLDIVRYQVYEASAGFWSDAEIYAYMWQAEAEIAQQVECTQYYDGSTTTVVDKASYSKPLNCLFLRKITWDKVALKELDMNQRDKETFQFQSYGQLDSKGNPHSYWQWGEDINLYPVPQSAKLLEFWYIRQPSKINATSTRFTVPAEFHNPIVEFCLSRMYFKDQDEQRGKMHFELWLQGLQIAKSKWTSRRKGNRFPTVKTEDNYPSTDLGII